jgi:hypothetical protein
MPSHTRPPPRGKPTPPPTKPPTAKNGVLSAFSSVFSFRGAPKNGARFYPTPCEMNVKRQKTKEKLPTDRRRDKKPKKNLKTHHNQTHEPQNLKKG